MSFEIAPPTLFTLFGVPVTNTIFTAWIVMLVLVIFARAATSRLTLVPGRLQSVAELLVEQFLAIGEQTADARRARQFLPLALTLFLFIVTANWMGILPLFGEGEFYLKRPAEHAATAPSKEAPAAGKEASKEAAVDKSHAAEPSKEAAGASHAAESEAHSEHEIGILRSANSDLNITFAMGLIVFFWFEFLGFKTGGLAYLKEFVWPGLLIEVISHVARPVALALRLFGNILAGEILLAVVTGQLFALVLPAAFMVFEMFVGVVQALIFALLTLAFLSMSTAHAAAHELADEAGEGITHH